MQSPCQTETETLSPAVRLGLAAKPLAPQHSRSLSEVHCRAPPLTRRRLLSASSPCRRRLQRGFTASAPCFDPSYEAAASWQHLSLTRPLSIQINKTSLSWKPASFYFWQHSWGALIHEPVAGRKMAGGKNEHDKWRLKLAVVIFCGLYLLGVIICVVFFTS